MIDGNLRHLLQEHTSTEWHWQPIETGGIAPGVPDMEGCRDGRTVWVELKATTTRRVTFRPLQPGWIMRRVRAGGRVLVMVRQMRGVPQTDTLHVYPGAAVLYLQKYGLVTEGALLRTSGGPSGWDWAAVERALVA